MDTPRGYPQPPPGWAAQVIGETCLKYRVPYPTVTWRRSKVNVTSSGNTKWNRSGITITAGTAEMDQVLVLLHELAHWIVINRHWRTRKGRGHTVEFWQVAFDLYEAHELTEFAKSRETRKYQKARQEAARR